MVSVLGVAVKSKKRFQFFESFSYFILRLGCVKSAENLAKIHRFFQNVRNQSQKYSGALGEREVTERSQL